MGVVGGKRVAGLGGLGNGRIDGRGREGCGPGMPGPYGVAEGCAGAGRKVSGCGVVSGHLCRGGVLDVPRRGQDPSLRCGVRRGV